MANSFALLLSYLDNLLWFCTRVVYGIIFIFEFNYHLVASIFRGCVQLWRFAVQGVVTTGGMIVAAIEFLGELPLRTYHLARYLTDLVTDIARTAFYQSMSWCWRTALDSVQFIQASTWKALDACMNGWMYVLDSIVAGFAHIVNSSNMQCSNFIEYCTEVGTNTGVALYNAKVSTQEAVLDFISVCIENSIYYISYPILILWDTLNSCKVYSQSVVQSLHVDVVFYSAYEAIINSLCDISKSILLVSYSLKDSLTNSLHDMLYILEQVSSFPGNLFYKFIILYDVFIKGLFACSESLFEFVIKNWYAMIALGLCFSLLISITIYLHVQHDRNIQNAIRDLSRLITSFTQSRARQDEAQQPRQEDDPLPEENLPQDQGEALEQNAPEEHEAHVQRLGNARGDADHPGPSRINRSGTYSLRERRFTPVDEVSADNGSVETMVKHLKHRLNEQHDRQMCVVCQDEVKNILLLPCRHLCTCIDCAETIISSPAAVQRQCPLCRSRIGSIVEVYS